MNHLYGSIAILFLFLVSLSSPAFGAEVLTCQTSDNLYRVSIVGITGTQYQGLIFGTGGTLLASYPIQRVRGRSISFGQTQYLDVQSQGQKFSLSMGSTNDRHIVLKAELTDGTQVLEADPTCKP